MRLVNWVQILYKAVYISLYTKAFGKYESISSPNSYT